MTSPPGAWVQMAPPTPADSPESRSLIPDCWTPVPARAGQGTGVHKRLKNG